MTKRIIPAMGEDPLWKVSAIQLDRFYVALSRQTGLGPSSIRQIHSIIRRAYVRAFGGVGSRRTRQ